MNQSITDDDRRRDSVDKVLSAVSEENRRLWKENDELLKENDKLKKEVQKQAEFMAYLQQIADKLQTNTERTKND